MNGSKRIYRRLWHSVNRYANADNRYIKDYDKTKELSYLKY